MAYMYPFFPGTINVDFAGEADDFAVAEASKRTRELVDLLQPTPRSEARHQYVHIHMQPLSL
jgi:hypothetical protein